MAAEEKRSLVKVSGEQMAGPRRRGIDEATTLFAAEEVATLISATGITPVLLPGGGNFIRGRDSGATNPVDRAIADYEGMEGTVTNAVALTEALRQLGQSAMCLVNIMPQLVVPEHKGLPSYDAATARQVIAKGTIPVIGGGNGRPYSSTDYAAVVVGGETGCEHIMKGTNVDGVFDKDPSIHLDAKLYDYPLTLDEVIEQDLDVLETTAWVVARTLGISVTVYNMLKKGNLLKAYRGEVGTLVEVSR